MHAWISVRDEVSDLFDHFSFLSHFDRYIVDSVPAGQFIDETHLPSATPGTWMLGYNASHQSSSDSVAVFSFPFQVHGVLY